MISYEDYKNEWLGDVIQGSPSTSHLGQRFAAKLVTQWKDVETGSDDLVICDGSGDGGIDIAYLERGSDDESGASGSTWYLIQSKYGSAFQGQSTLISEGRKVIDTLVGRRQKLSSFAEGLVERVLNFKAEAGDQDRIVLVYATVDPLDPESKHAAEDVKTLGRASIGPLFDVDAVSINTIYDRLLDEEEKQKENTLEIDVVGDLVPCGEDLLVGSVTLIEIYEFLKKYKDKTQDLDKLYEKNVRRFLGGRGKVNKAVQATLRDQPERFGLYNNGITIVAGQFSMPSKGVVRLADPYVVNGCQTTRSIWDVCRQKLDLGASGSSPALESWRQRASKGVVVVKVAKVGTSGDALLQDVTRFTNSQNAVREKDFLALTLDFRSWAEKLADTYGVFLETQRGGWDSQKALQKQNPSGKVFFEHANAFDLIKVYGAGWLGEAGLAFGKNPPFLPNGSVFKRITEGTEEGGAPFGVDDLYAAYLLQKIAVDQDFGRGSAKPSRRQTRFLFYRVSIDFLSNEFRLIAAKNPTRTDISQALIRLHAADVSKEVRDTLFDRSAETIDAYMSNSDEGSVQSEIPYRDTYHGDLNAFLKWEKLGRAESTPVLRGLIATHQASMSYPKGSSPRDHLRQYLRML